jgi:hypothetical protein
MFRIWTLTIALWALGLLVLAGCKAPEETPMPELPPPGTLELVSVQPLESIQRRNLILNGTFDEWYAGAPAPTGFNAPQAAQSTLRRDAEVSAIGPQGFRAIQRWKKNDSDTGAKARFGAWVTVQPGTQYELRVLATSWSGGTAVIDIFEETAEGELRILEAQAITVEPEVTIQEYTKTFTAGESTRIFIGSGLPAGVEPAGSIVWHDWFLY